MVAFLLEGTMLAPTSAYGVAALPQIKGAPVSAKLLTNLAGHIRTCWEEAKRAKMPIETQIIKALRQRMGQYEPDKLAAMKTLFGNDYTPPFTPLTGVKC